MLDLETLINETATTRLDQTQLLHRGQQYQSNTVAKKLTHRWGKIVADDLIIVPKTLRYAAFKALHFAHPELNKICNDAAVFWWPEHAG